MDAATAAIEGRMPTPELEARIAELAGHLHAADRRWLGLIAEFDRREGWLDALMPSCAHWLGWKCGLDLGTAREKLRVAHALEGLPAIAAAMERGELSYSKVRAMTRIATFANEQVLLTAALHSTAHAVEKLVRQFRRGQESLEVSREALQYANRRLTWSHDDDGALKLQVHVPAEMGSLLLRALEAALVDIPLPDVAAETLPSPVPESQAHVSAEASSGPRSHASAETPSRPSRCSDWAARRADALLVIAESYLKHGLETLNGGERHSIVVHLDAAALQAAAEGRCELEDGPSVPVATARRLACDASVVTINADGRGEPLDVGRKTRSIPPALRRALEARDRGCVFPGCTRTRYVDGHHIQHWADGGDTKLANLVTLCRFHHRAVHEGGVRVERLDDGAWRFTRPDGRVLESVAPGHTRPLGGAWAAGGVESPGPRAPLPAET